MRYSGIGLPVPLEVTRISLLSGTVVTQQDVTSKSCYLPVFIHSFKHTNVSLWNNSTCWLILPSFLLHNCSFGLKKQLFNFYFYTWQKYCYGVIEFTVHVLLFIWSSFFAGVNSSVFNVCYIFRERRWGRLNKCMLTSPEYKFKMNDDRPCQFHLIK